MDLRITEGTYSRDNHDFSLCTTGDAAACWIAWSAYGEEGSRGFVRNFDGSSAGNILPLSERGTLQMEPLCVPAGERVYFVWLDKDGGTYSICRRAHDGRDFSEIETLHDLPARAKACELHAACDANGSLWVAWQQAIVGASTVELLRIDPDGGKAKWSPTAGPLRDYRPRLATLDRGGVYIVWDSYGHGGYGIYGCTVSEEGAGEVVRISGDPEWETKAAICLDGAGQLWCAWVWWKDATWKRSVIHQKFSIRGARFDGDSWQPLTGCDGSPDLAPLHYGLLTDFDRKTPALGHQGRRLHPMLRAAEEGGVWLFYETKMDDAVQTTQSQGRLCAQRFSDGEWAEPLNVAEGLVRYELPHDGTVGAETYLVGRDIDYQCPNPDVDELHLRRVRLSPDLSPVPAQARSVDLAHWQEIDLPMADLHDPAGQRTCLPSNAEGKYQLIWGDFHVHSAGSVECEGEPDELAHYARDKSRIHALTISDNDHFWSCGARKNQRWLTDHEWDTNVGNAKALNEPGRFALFPGYEQTINAEHGSDSERLLHNHTSVMADDDDMERDLLHFDPRVRRAIREGRRLSNRDIVECVRLAREKGHYPLPHAHTNWWRLVDPEIQTACDVTTAWLRNIECYDIYHTYLDRGLRFGFTGSSDGHYRNPGFGGALTGLWVTEVSRSAVLEALRTRRTYATAGQRILVEFAINDTFMGDMFVVDDDPVLRWRVLAQPDEDYVLRVLRDGRVMHEERFTGTTEGEICDERLMVFRQGQHYYYLEIESAEPIPDYLSNVAHALGGKAWSSPIWLETADWIAR